MFNCIYSLLPPLPKKKQKKKLNSLLPKGWNIWCGASLCLYITLHCLSLLSNPKWSNCLIDEFSVVNPADGQTLFEANFCQLIPSVHTFDKGFKQSQLIVNRAVWAMMQVGGTAHQGSAGCLTTDHAMMHYDTLCSLGCITGADSSCQPSTHHTSWHATHRLHPTDCEM